MPFKNRKQWLACLLALFTLAFIWPGAALAQADRAQLDVVITPAQDQDHRLIFEIDMKVANGGEGQAIYDVRFSYKGTQIAAVDQVFARSDAYTRSVRIDGTTDSLPERFTVDVSYSDFDGSLVEREIMVDYKAQAPKLSFTRTASTQTAGKDEKIKLTYTLKNEGKVALTDVQVYDDMEGVGLIGAVDSLYPGETQEYTHEIKMTKDVQSKPRVSYTPANATLGMVMMLDPMNLALYNPKLAVTLKADYASVQAGEAVTLTCSVVNEGNVAFTNVTISDPILGNIVENTKIEVGKSYSWTKIIKPVETGAYSCTVRASDENGSPYTVISNSISIAVAGSTSTEPDSESLELAVTANTTSLAQPGNVTFNVLVRNVSQEIINNLTIADAAGNVLQTVGMMSLGDRMFPITLNVAGSAEYIFVVEGTLPSGQLVRKTSVPVSVLVGGLSVQPSALPSQTPDALGISGKGVLAPWLLGLIVLVVLLIIACVIVLVWLQFRSNRASGEDEYNIQPPPRSNPPPVQRRAYEEPEEEYDSFREEISRYATEYSKPQRPAAPPAPPNRELRVEPLRRDDDDDDIPTVYHYRGPKEPRTKRNDK